MTPRIRWRLVLAPALLAASAFAQTPTTFNEIEPNSQKSQATLANGMVAGDALKGISTGQVTTLGNTTDLSVDVFRVRTAALPLGIYKHRLTLTTGTTQFIQATTIRGLNQTGLPGTASTGGTIGTVDAIVQSGAAQIISGSSPQAVQRRNQWYGFGKGEEIYYRVSGSTATTANYQATLSTSTVAPVVLSDAFESSSPITITTVGQTASDTMIHVFDANLDPLPRGSNDDEGPNGATPQSRLVRTLSPGWYYLAVSSAATAWSQASPNDEDVFSNVVDFPGSLVRTSLATAAQSWNFKISAQNGTVLQIAGLPLGQPTDPNSALFDIAWFKFEVMASAPIILPPNDACSSAIPVSPSGTDLGIVAGATLDGSSSCDTSPDVWYRFTNSTPFPRILSADTCGSSFDTVLSVHSSCPGTASNQVDPVPGAGCNDDCLPAPLPPCSATSSCVSGIPVNVNQTVYLRLANKGGTGVEYTLHTTVVAATPQNDDCAAPQVLGGAGLYSFDISSATTGTQGQALTAPCTSPALKDVWYELTPTLTGTLTVSTCGGVTSPGSTDTIIAVYATRCPSGPGLACNDDDYVNCPSEYASVVSLPVTCGQLAAIQLGSFSNSSQIWGNFDVNLTGTPTQCPTPTTAFCLGDGTGAPCPCTPTPNNGAAGHGCGSSAFPGGAFLTSAGVASDETSGTDTLVLTANDIPGPALFIQGSGTTAPVAFGDGQLCVTGIIRLGVAFPSGTSAAYPGPAQNEIHVQGVASSGATRHYQAWYRSVPGLCATSNQNLTQGLTLTWGP